MIPRTEQSIELPPHPVSQPRPRRRRRREEHELQPAPSSSSRRRRRARQPPRRGRLAARSPGRLWRVVAQTGLEAIPGLSSGISIETGTSTSVKNL